MSFGSKFDVSGVQFDGLGQYDGVVEHALAVAKVPPYFDPVKQLITEPPEGAKLALSGYLDSPEAKDLEYRATILEEATISQIRYVDQKKFRPILHYSEEFGLAASSLLVLYRKPFFGFPAAQARHCTAMHILEHTNATYQDYLKISIGKSVLSAMVINPFKESPDETPQDGLRNMIKQLEETDLDEFRAMIQKSGM